MATEDFQTYTEVEGASATITIDANTVDADDVQSDETNQVYKDFTANYFAEDFEIIFNVYVDLYGAWAYHLPWEIANSTSDADDQVTNNENFLAVQLFEDASPLAVFRLVESDGGDGGTVYTDASGEITEQIWYYVRVKRVEAVGTYGTLYCDVYTSAADRTNEANAFANLSITLHTAKRDYRYMFALNGWSHDANAYPSDIDVEDMEIISVGAGAASVIILRRRRT